MSCQTSTWPSVSPPAPIPIVGTASARVAARATAAGIASSTIAKQPPPGARARPRRARAAAPPSGPAREAAEPGRRLRRQADVAHHRDARARRSRAPGTRRAAALELHRVGAALLDEPHRVPRRPARPTPGTSRTACRRPRGPLRAAGHPRRHEDDLVERDRHRRGAPCTTMPDESPTRIMSTPAASARRAARRVVGGDHHDLLAAALQLGELGQRSFPAVQEA